MALGWDDFKAVLAGERLPAALVDLDALDRNVDRIRAAAERAGKTIRVGSKSVRHVGLLRRILARGGAVFRGIMGFTAEEIAFLADEGFDDLLLAYPTVQPAALAMLAERAARGRTIWAMVDTREHLEALGRAGRAAGVEMRAVAELDVSYRRAAGHVHLGVRRSPLREPRQVLELARAAAALEGVRLAGLMAYEAHIAGFPDKSPFSPAMNRVSRVLKRLSIPDVARSRAATVELLRREGFPLELVNGGGTGSVGSTSAEACVSEVTVGSGFVCSHIFDYFESIDCEPAAFFALEACRISDPGFVTCLGGGYIASGTPSWEKSPRPWLPAGLTFLPNEGAGEVQTPLAVPAGAPPIRIGDPVIFRHAKAGELAERFTEYLLLRDGKLVAREPTYRGNGFAFL